MNNAASSVSASVFRTEAWVQAWIDTWGKDPRIRLIDLGGRNNPLEQVYLIKYRLKKILPVNTLCLAGVGYGALSTPRAEYNDLDALIKMAGGIDPLRQELSKLKWQQFVITDIDTSTPTVQQIEQLAATWRWAIHTEKTEPAYAIRQTNLDDYLKGLGSNTRLAYFNRRERLAQQGEIAFIEYALQESAGFFAQLNQFHLKRWGSPCYSAQSQAFMKNFAERLAAAGGKVIMQGLTVNGELVSVLFDVIWGNTRYNLQSGYAENRFNKIALGSLHFGYAIQAALEQGQDYDFMAGNGKHSNYKKQIANNISAIQSKTIQIRALNCLQIMSDGMLLLVR